MTIRSIRKIFKGQPPIEGAGVKLKRGFGGQDIPPPYSLVDPFLLFDDFNSTYADDYTPTLHPVHPHRGLKTVMSILEGEVEHKESIGNDGTIKRGDVPRLVM
jgi:redox-sensitive bicupin YhaK (pirin superfamily)